MSSCLIRKRLWYKLYWNHTKANLRKAQYYLLLIFLQNTFSSVHNILLKLLSEIIVFEIYPRQEANCIWNYLWNANHKPVSHKWGFPLHVVYYCSLIESLVYKKNLCKSVIEHLVSYEKSSYMVMVIWNINR